MSDLALFDALAPRFDWLREDLRRVEGKVDDCLDWCKTLNDKLEALMTKAQDLKDLLTHIDQATTDAAARVQAILDQIKGGVTAAEADSIIAQGQPIVQHLQAIGKDPNAPVPPTP